MSPEIPAVTASYTSRCPLCDEIIFEGDLISYYEEEWVHTVCIEEAALGIDDGYMAEADRGH